MNSLKTFAQKKNKPSDQGRKIWYTLGVDVLTGYEFLENFCTNKNNHQTRDPGAPGPGPKIWCTLGVDVFTGYDFLQNFCTNKKNIRPRGPGPLSL